MCQVSCLRRLFYIVIVCLTFQLSGCGKQTGKDISATADVAKSVETTTRTLNLSDQSHTSESPNRTSDSAATTVSSPIEPRELETAIVFDEKYEISRIKCFVENNNIIVKLTVKCVGGIEENTDPAVYVVALTNDKPKGIGMPELPGAPRLGHEIGVVVEVSHYLNAASIEGNDKITGFEFGVFDVKTGDRKKISTSDAKVKDGIWSL